MIILLAAGIVAVSQFTLAWSIYKMAVDLTALTAAVGSLETVAATAVTDLGTAGAGPKQADVDALTTRVDTVVTNLTAATTPAA